MKENEKNEIFIYTKTNERHRHKVVIWRAGEYKYMYHVASFNNVEQLENFLNMIGASYTYEKTLNEGDSENEIKIYRTNYLIQDAPPLPYFWKLEELPKNAIKFRALSNGSIVWCYFCKDTKTKTINIYRPNPNAKEIYKPLTTQEHIAHQQLYGIY